MAKRLLVIATLDTKGREAAFVAETAQKLGFETVLMDIGTLNEPLVAPDINRYQLALAAQRDLNELVKNGDRSGAVQVVQDGGTIVAGQLAAEKAIDAVFGMGGGTGTAIVTSIMRSLPYGLPKLVVSTVASRDVREYVGTKDIVMFHSVADLLGVNEFTRLILSQAVSAVCGMALAGSDFLRRTRLVAVTAYGINSACAVFAEPALAEKGYEMIGFHANGCGGMAMERLIEEGWIAGVLELTPHEIADELFDGYCRGIGENRLETAGRMGVPFVFAPGGLDNAVFSPHYPMPDSLKGRRVHQHDTRFCVRMEAAEMEKFADIVARKLNQSKGPGYVLIPARGWSEADKPGMELFDPDLDRIFTRTLKGLLDARIPVEEVDLHISAPEFARQAVAILHEMIHRKDENERRMSILNGLLERVGKQR
jgi:uncharacterized protein (UPF0261 family)